MKRNFLAVIWLALVVGCIDNATQHAENLAVGGAYEAALVQCVDDAVLVRADAGPDAAGDYYESCAKRADVKYGRKTQ